VEGVDLWAVDLDGSDAAALRALPEADLRDAARLAFPRHRQRLLAGRAAVRAVLAAYRGVAAASLGLERAPGGKPGLPGGPPFSFSRSGAAGLLAVGGGRALGVDLEALRPVPEAAGLAVRHLSPAEQGRWRAEGGGSEAFLRAWTRLEASLKALGVGLGEAAEGLLALEPALARITVRDLDLVLGHAAALALGAPV
jgi:4'-phosphopantetheinyl transferase